MQRRDLDNLDDEKNTSDEYDYLIDKTLHTNYDNMINIDDKLEVK